MFLAKKIVTQGSINWLVPKQIGTNTWLKINYMNDNLFQGVGVNGSFLYLRDITQYSQGSHGTSNWWGVSESSTTRVAVGENGNIWTDKFSGTDTEQQIGDGTWYDVIYSSKFIAVGRSGDSVIITSDDGVSWRTVVSSNTSSNRPVFYDIFYDIYHQKYITVGSKIYTSTNGTTWSNRAEWFGRYWHSVAANNNIIIAVGLDGYITTSSNGTSWETPQQIGMSDAWYGIAYGKGYFVAVGANGYIMTSKDGTNWNEPMQLGTQNWRSIAYGEGKFNIVGNNGYVTTGFI